MHRLFSKFHEYEEYECNKECFFLLQKNVRDDIDCHLKQLWEEQRSCVFCNYGNEKTKLILTLTSSHHFAIDTFYDGILYALLNGKRFRGFIFMAAVFSLIDNKNAQMLRYNDKDTKNIMDIACAIECIHAYSLVHDDLPCMDNDDMRRGRPSVHKAYSESSALLIGDALLIFAFEVLARIEDRVVASLLIKELARACGMTQMIKGQMLDMHYRSNKDKDKDNIDIWRDIARCKTSSLICFCFLAAGIVLQKDQLTLNDLKEFGNDVGRLYQLLDDISDWEQDKNVGAMNIMNIIDKITAKKKVKNILEKIVKKTNVLYEKKQLIHEIIDNLVLSHPI